MLVGDGMFPDLKCLVGVRNAVLGSEIITSQNCKSVIRPYSPKSQVASNQPFQDACGRISLLLVSFLEGLEAV